MGEPHWHSGIAARILDAGHFDRMLGSLYSLPVGQRFFEPPELSKQRPAAEVIREYLGELPRCTRRSFAGGTKKVGSRPRLEVTHDPTLLTRGFAEAAAMVESHGFRPGRHPYDFWIRSD